MRSHTILAGTSFFVFFRETGSRQKVEDSDFILGKVEHLCGRDSQVIDDMVVDGDQVQARAARAAPHRPRIFFPLGCERVAMELEPETTERNNKCIKIA